MRAPRIGINLSGFLDSSSGFVASCFSPDLRHNSFYHFITLRMGGAIFYLVVNPSSLTGCEKPFCETDLSNKITIGQTKLLGIIDGFAASTARAQNIKKMNQNFIRTEERKESPDQNNGRLPF